MIFEKYKNISGVAEINGKGKDWKIPYDDEGKEFSQVYHITHLPASKYLLETNKIIPQLIQDESKLNKERIKVIWLSPNKWVEGSLYGNVRFTYDFASLIAGKSFYAVEVMEKYTPKAFRILITQKDYSGNALLEAYDPDKINNGPWYRNPGGQNFYHKDYNIEFMFEDELLLKEAIKVDFVDHHPKYCNIYDDKTCPYLKLSHTNAEMLFVAYLVANDLKVESLNLFLALKESWPLMDIYLVFEKIVGLFTNNTFEGSKHLSKDTRSQIGKAILNLIAKQEKDNANILSRAFGSKKDLEDTIKGLIADYFGVDASELSYDKIINSK